MNKYILLYFSLFLCLVFVQVNPGGQNASSVPGNTCVEATDCVIESYVPLTITRAGEEIDNLRVGAQVYLMLGVLIIFGLCSGFVEVDVSFWRPMYFVLLGTFLSVFLGLNTVSVGSIMIPFIPLELWIGFLGALVPFFGGAVRVMPIGFILGFYFSKLAFMSTGGPLYFLFTFGILLVIADHIISSLLHSLRTPQLQVKSGIPVAETGLPKEDLQNTWTPLTSE
jgi:hypothetical protein